MTRPVALFDFDGTLIKGDSLLPFLHFVCGTWRFAQALGKTLPYLVGYRLDYLSNCQAKEYLLTNTLGGWTWQQVSDLGVAFANAWIPSKLRDDTVARLRWHQTQGHSCILVSASLDVYLKPWAKAHGFAFCLSSKLEKDQFDKITGRLAGGNCHGEEKVHRIRALFAKIGRPTRVYAYGDSPGDAAMLRYADEGIWV